MLVAAARHTTARGHRNGRRLALGTAGGCPLTIPYFARRRRPGRCPPASLRRNNFKDSAQDTYVSSRGGADQPDQPGCLTSLVAGKALSWTT